MSQRGPVRVKDSLAATTSSTPVCNAFGYYPQTKLGG